MIAHEMPDHPKIATLSDAAFRLLITAWAYCSRLETDGVIPDVVWRRMGTAKARKELLTEPASGGSPLVVQRNGFIECHDYLQHQRSHAEIAEMRTARTYSGAFGAHTRWHVGRRQPDPSCPYCVEQGPSDEG